QRFDKSKFGKSWNVYRKRPHIVCLGAMKNFAHFNNWLQEQKDEDWQNFFRKTVALVLLWNSSERIVRRAKFGGYTHAIVAYTLAWLHHITDLRIDLDRLWEKQVVDESLLVAIEVLSITVNDHIRSTNLNVTEWCKKEDCWNNLKKLKVPQLPSMADTYISGNNTSQFNDSSSSEKENINFCVEKGADAWFELSKWLKERGFMQGKQRSQCFNMGKKVSASVKGNGEPSAILSQVCRSIWEKAENGYGWTHNSDKR
ncbi:MAG: AIPR family protein, partial [Flavobacteriaceae bacterium]